MAKYKLVGDTETDGVRDDQGRFIPCSSGNRHWREYLKWREEGNTPNPALSPKELEDKAKAEEMNKLKDSLKKLPEVLLKYIMSMHFALTEQQLLRREDFEYDGGNLIDDLNSLKATVDITKI